MFLILNLNTSYVEVKLGNIYDKVQAKVKFKYILC